MKTASTLLLILASSVAPAIAAAPAWDSSGNGQLNGNYYFRQVLYQADAGGNASGFYAYYGNIAFNGTGSYAITNATFLSLTSQGLQSGSAPANGTYSVSASGYGFMASPIISGENVFFMVSNHILVGSETESGNNDLFIAAPIGTLSNSNFSGSYTFSGFFPGGTPTDAADATFQLNPDGAGRLNNVNISGFSGGGATLTQSSSNVTYKFSNNAAVITFPTNNTANFFPGQEFAYFSPDTDFVFGGSPTGFDMFIGVRNASSGTSTPLSGLYYEAGLEESAYTGIDSFYGSFNALPSGDIVGHERIFFSADTPKGTTYKSTFPTTLSGTYTDPSNGIQFTIGHNGFRLFYETGGYLGIGIALPYTPPAPPTAAGTVYIDPTGIVNTASSAPYTAGISPGDFLTFYNGVNLSKTNGLVLESGAPIPKTLDGVQVLIDGLPSPIFYVSPTQLSVLVPYDVATYPVASIQVKNNGVLSNVVTMFVNTTTPGVFTANYGIGVGSMVDFPPSGGYYIVSPSQPAHPGDTIAAYLSGLGTPFPSNAIGDIGPADGSGSLVHTINVDVNGTDVGTLGYAGLAPGYAGLYQINFTIPTTVSAGNNALGITGPDSYTNEATLPIATSGSSVRRPLDAKPANRLSSLPRLNSGQAR